MFSRMALLTLPSSLFEGLIRRHFGLVSKLPLWSFKVIKAGVLPLCQFGLQYQGYERSL